MNRLIMVLCLIATSAWAVDNGQYQNVDPKIRDWFEKQRAPNSRVPCCSISDGHITTWRKSEKEGFEYEVPIEGEWHVVPPEVIIRNSGNPTGSAIVWFVKQYSSTYHIRCFVLGPEG